MESEKTQAAPAVRESTKLNPAGRTHDASESEVIWRENEVTCADLHWLAASFDWVHDRSQILWGQRPRRRVRQDASKRETSRAARKAIVPRRGNLACWNQSTSHDESPLRLARPCFLVLIRGLYSARTTGHRERFKLCTLYRPISPAWLWRARLWRPRKGPPLRRALSVVRAFATLRCSPRSDREKSWPTRRR